MIINHLNAILGSFKYYFKFYKYIKIVISTSLLFKSLKNVLETTFVPLGESDISFYMKIYRNFWRVYFRYYLSISLNLCPLEKIVWAQ